MAHWRILVSNENGGPKPPLPDPEAEAQEEPEMREFRRSVAEVVALERRRVEAVMDCQLRLSQPSAN